MSRRHDQALYVPDVVRFNRSCCGSVCRGNVLCCSNSSKIHSTLSRTTFEIERAEIHSESGTPQEYNQEDSAEDCNRTTLLLLRVLQHAEESLTTMTQLNTPRVEWWKFDGLSEMGQARDGLGQKSEAPKRRTQP
ncbi:protein of unknown function [Candidatus Filomicrobium marinum]|uniref:Uncharacterized protein n=1 Tax=Candidatus Filomicrobium marinum TaxID=1608628 RepID=A0A0D6JFR3_9HYPH|nr:protein of unknown function [Candidatus Filomicrobium marinum]